MTFIQTVRFFVGGAQEWAPKLEQKPNSIKQNAGQLRRLILPQLADDRAFARACRRRRSAHQCSTIAGIDPAPRTAGLFRIGKPGVNQDAALTGGQAANNVDLPAKSPVEAKPEPVGKTSPDEMSRI